MKRKFLVVIVALLLPFALFSQQAEKDGISKALQSGNAQTLSGYFAQSVDLTLLDIEDVYSAKQAEIILAKFFTENAPSKFQLKHEGTSKVEDLYYIGMLSTENGLYRVTFFLKKNDNAFRVKQLRIESDE